MVTCVINIKMSGWRVCKHGHLMMQCLLLLPPLSVKDLIKFKPLALIVIDAVLGVL
jgi:hypothetical protein